jgi:hypothetical protein
MSGVEGRWTIYGEATPGLGGVDLVASGPLLADGESVPVVPCDEAAVERGTDALIRQEGFEPDEDSRDAWREHARAVLRAAGAVDDGA